MKKRNYGIIDEERANGCVCVSHERKEFLSLKCKCFSNNLVFIFVESLYVLNVT